MKQGTMKACLVLATTSALAACGGTYDAPPPMDPPPPPPPQSVDFSQFVHDLFAMTANDTDPVAVDDAEFSFDFADDPAAFGDLLDGGNP